MSVDKSLLLDKYSKQYLHAKRNEKLNKLIQNFIKDNKLLVYGGFNMDYVIRKISGGTDYIYPEGKTIYDYDVMATDFVKKATMLGKHLQNNGYKVKIVTGVTGKTRKIFVDISSDAIIDISLIENFEYRNMQVKEIDGFLFVDPQFLKLDIFKMCLIHLYHNYYRIPKAIDRLIKMEHWFPLSNAGNQENIENIDLYKNEDIKFLDKSVDEIVKTNIAILGGDYVYYLYYPSKRLKNTTKPVDVTEHEVIIYTNTLINKPLPITGKLRRPGYRIMPLEGEYFYNLIPNTTTKIVIKLHLLYQYYHLRFYHKSSRYDRKILTLLQDPETFNIYNKGLKYPIFFHKTEILTTKLKKIPHEYYIPVK